MLVDLYLGVVALSYETNIGSFISTDLLQRGLPRDHCSVLVLVSLDMRGAGVGVVKAGHVEHLELLVLEGAHRTDRVFHLGEVDIVTLESEPGNERV